MKDYSKPAFPSGNEVEVGGITTAGHAGMTLRDYFAAKAMQAIHTHAEGFGWTAKEIAVTAYAQADAMLVERAA